MLSEKVMFYFGSTRNVLVCGNELRINDPLTRCRLREIAKQLEDTAGSGYSITS